MISLSTTIYVAGASIVSYGGWRCVAQPIWGKFKPIWELSDILQGKNIDKHGKDAPQPLKDLAMQLKLAHETFDENPEKGCRTANDALASFLSHSQHSNMVERPLLQSLMNLFTEVQTPTSPNLKILLGNCHESIQEAVEKIQGRLTKIKKFARSLFHHGRSTILNHIRDAGPHPDESTLHPLLKIRKLLERPDDVHRNRLIRHFLERLGLKTVTIETLDQHVKHALYNIQTFDREGFDLICKKLKFDLQIPIFSKSQSDLDKFFVEYQQLRKEKPLLPNHSTLPVELQWNTPTNYEREKNKAFDLSACFGALVVFQMRYGANERTKKDFYQVLSRSHSMSPSKRKRAILEFFKDERERLGNAWLPWTIDERIFEGIYLLLRTTTSQFVSDSPFLENIKGELKDTPIPSMVFLGEKASRYFHYLVNKYAEWCREYPYDMTMDSFLKNKLYKRQESSQGSLNLGFFLSRYNLVQNLQELSDRLYLWACAPCFRKDQFLALLNPLLVLVKQVALLLPRTGVQLLKLPAILLQWVLNVVFLVFAEQILVHTRLFEKVDEIVTEALLDPSPYQFPLLEVVLNNLREILEIIEKNSKESIPSHPESNRAKRALKETVRTFGAFAKALDTLEDPKEKPGDQTVFETILPPAMDKIFETLLRVHADYSKKDDLKHRGTEFLQAHNFYVYNKHKPTEADEALIKRHQEVKQHIALYIRKIANALIVQTSSEELSDDIGNFVKEILSGAQDAQFSNLTQNYINRNKALIIEVIKKSYIMKGLFVHLITQDKDL